MSAALVLWVFVIFVLLLLMGLPIVTGMSFASLIPHFANAPGATDMSALVRSIFGSADNTSLLAIPLFILAGIIMSKGAIAQKLFDVFQYFTGRITGGLPCAAVITCLFFGAISGSAAATAAAVGSMTYPLLVDMGYDKKFSAALIVAAGALGVIIPPSIPFVVYASTTGVSLGDLFLAGFIPGTMIAVFLMAYCILYCKRYGEDREKVDGNYRALREKGFVRVFADGFWALLSPVVVLGGIYAGIVTPTEAACLSVFYSLFVSLFIYKTIKVDQLLGLMRDAVDALAPMCLILPIATAFGRALTLLKAPATLSTFILENFNDKNIILLVIFIFLFLLGMVMDTTPALLVLPPILLPLMNSIGVDLVHFGIFMTCNLAIGCVTPPFGVDLFVVSGQTKIPPLEIGKKAIPLIVVFTAAVLLITYIPEICLFLVY